MSIISNNLIVSGSLWLLGGFSLVTWTLIVSKGFQQLRLREQNRRFTQAFWSASDLRSASVLSEQGAVARVAESGFRALKSADESGRHDLQQSWDRQDLLERQLRQQIHKERRSLESGLAVLASIGSTSPFIGLFGTVFGIIEALSAISSNASASIDVVAGPIGHALIATGIGIAVALPAVLSYNFFLRRLKLVSADLDDFATDFLSLAQKAGFRIGERSVAERSDSAARPSVALVSDVKADGKGAYA